jgi:spore maturation protein CgeB
MVFQVACKSKLNLNVWDRNSDRKLSDYRYPDKACINVKPAVAYEKTGQIYKDHLISLNVNTIEDSETMYSRRLVEILACGGIAVTNATLAVEKYFKEYCYTVSTEAEAERLFERLKKGPSKEDLQRARAGAEYVAKEHTWTHRLEEIRRVVGL